ncbi:protein screw [Musca domestica]|uniref:Protein screw n=1 Tax=Musca domestica TaxID=7370 RepID=A0A1I8M9Y9_MUSDO|nr:protein screw [Musca domestica]
MLKLENILLYLIALRSIETHDLKIDYTMETIDRLPLQSDHLPELTGYEFEIVDILGLGPENHGQPKISLKNSASKFLLEVYNDITENEQELDHVRQHLTRGRQRRALRDERFITKYDRMEIEKCNNIITFSSKQMVSNPNLIADLPIATDMQIGFNTNDVPRDLQLAHSALRLYQQPSLGKFVQNTDVQRAIISIYQRVMVRKQYTGALRILASVNTTTAYKGWLEFNMTRILSRWLQHKSLQIGRLNELLVGVTLEMENPAHESKSIEILPSDLGLVQPNVTDDMIDLQPFIIGYFNGPELMTKIQKLRFKREVIKRKRKAADYYNRPPPPPVQEIYRLPTSCERLNFTLDFNDLQMHDWVIAPKKFEAFFCGGECNFPLGSKMNATNHAIVQTLMHLKQPNLPKPCCVPTVLGSISILHYLNEDSVNLSKYPQSVAKECGCH